MLNRLFHITWSALVLDLWTLVARRDPYFVPGPPPAPQHPLPAAFAVLPPAALSLFRTACAGGGIIAALFCYFSAYQLLHVLVIAPLLSRRSGRPPPPLWQYPGIFGSFTANVLDRGLAGFWGGWWHQSFRLGFTAPAAWLVRRGYLPPQARAADALIAFSLSGLIHAAGARTALPDTTRAWYPVAFFLLNFAGVLAQTALCAVVLGTRLRRDALPRLWRRAGNLLFVLGWLHATRWALIDDMSRAAIWLYEPVPVSPLRFVGFGAGTDTAWWRWDAEYIPRWYWAEHWWQSGIQL